MRSLPTSPKGRSPRSRGNGLSGRTSAARRVAADNGGSSTACYRCCVQHRCPRITAVLIAVIASGCDDAGSDGTMSTPAAATGPAWFTDVAAASGLVFEHTTGATGAFYFPEIAGSGCGLFDYDGDGDLAMIAR